VGNQIGHPCVGGQQQTLRQFEGVERFTFPPLPTVPQHSLNRHFASPHHREIQFACPRAAEQHQPAPRGRKAQGLVEGLAVPHAIVDQGEATPGIHLRSHRRPIGRRARPEHRTSRTISWRHRQRGTEPVGEVALVGPLRLGHDIPIESQRTERPDRGEGDGTAPDHQHTIRHVGQRLQHRMYSNRQRLQQDRGVVVQCLIDRVDLRLVRDETLAPPAGKIAVVPQREPPCQRPTTDVHVTGLAPAGTRAGNAGGARRAHFVGGEPTHRAGHDGVEDNALPRTYPCDRRADGGDSCQHLVAQHAWERRERLHQRAGIEGEAPDVGATDAARNHVSANPVIARKFGSRHVRQAHAAEPAEHGSVGHTAQCQSQDVTRNREVERHSSHRQPPATRVARAQLRSQHPHRSSTRVCEYVRRAPR
jgi:hypothetical protein